MVALEDIRNALDKTLGRDIELARRLAGQYVQENPTHFEGLRDLSRDECVQAVDVFRVAGMSDYQWAVEAWLLHTFEPEPVFGALNQPLDIETLLKGTTNG